MRRARRGCYPCGMSTLPVGPDKTAQLAACMAALGVREADLEEVFVRAGGPGGQNVNKKATCVWLRHRPTGVQVKCQVTRHQGLNRLLARQQLLARLEDLRRREAAERAQRAKRRRQQRPLSAAAKARRREAKARRAERKAARRPVKPEGFP